MTVGSRVLRLWARLVWTSALLSGFGFRGFAHTDMESRSICMHMHMHMSMSMSVSMSMSISMSMLMYV